MKLIVGLGNPGREYINTRHNIGFMCLDYYLNEVKWTSNSYGMFYKTKINGEDVIFLKPKTFMNLSGNAVLYFMNYYKIDIKDLLVIQDDLDLHLGIIRIKHDSGSGGHNGIKSIISSINSSAFCRIKIGIAKPNDNDVIDYVLHKFSTSEMDVVNNSFVICKNIIDDFINSYETEKLMNKYN